MINPTLSNFQLELSENFFPEDLTKRYDNYLFNLNNPFKSMKASFHESIQLLNIPGLNLSPLVVNGLNNLGKNPIDRSNFPIPTMNHAYDGHDSWWNSLESTILTISLRNNIINWMYAYEIAYKRFQRTDRVDTFQIRLVLLDSAEIPIIKITFSDCFIVTTPGLEFAFNSSFNESKTFDLGIQFNDMDVDLCVPEFKTTEFKTTE